MFQRQNKSIWRAVSGVMAATTAWLAFPHQAFAKPPAKPKPVSQLAARGLTQTPSAALRKKIAAHEAAAAEKNKSQVDIRPLSAKEMLSLRGRGPYRNAYFNGTMPWQRSLRDVNLSNGNLFKSFTDVQVAPSRGAGLVLQRTYNSNDERVGPFGIGWTHAYDIRIEEAGVDPNTGDEIVPRTDFFGGKHKYQRDADGLYSPPPYLFDEMDSKYDEFLVNGPPEVLEDTQRGMDGTVKRFIPGGTDPNGTPSSYRVCDYIEDRHGNKTTFTYNPVPLPGGGTKKLLTQVTDPSGRSLYFAWQNLGTAQSPAYRIVEVQGPLYRVTYEYNAELNLWKVHLDPDGLDRITTFGYTSYVGQDGTETGLLSSITDPLGHSVSYQYTLPQYGFTGTLWVTQIIEPGSGGSLIWSIFPEYYGTGTPWVSVTNNATQQANFKLILDGQLRMSQYSHLPWVNDNLYVTTYDSANNVTQVMTEVTVHDYPNPEGLIRKADNYTYGPHGNVLTHRVNNSATVTTTSYYPASKYFQKESVTDPLGRVTRFDYLDKFDASAGNRGNVKWVRDAGYSVSGSPSYQKQFDYTYNQYGQKATETNLSGVVTQFTYGDTWGNLTQVVQDVGTGKLNRTTQMVYDVAGRVQQSTDPMGRTSTFTYNNLGQPLTASFPATASTPAETVSYSYALNGRTETVTDNRGTTSIAYESGNDRVSSVTDPVTGAISYVYDLAGKRTSVTLPGGGTWTYTYGAQILPKDDPNSASREVISISDDNGRKVDIDCDWSGAPFKVKSNQTFDAGGALVSYQQTIRELESGGIDGRGWMTRIKNTWHWKDAQSNWQQRVLVQNDYTYNNSGQRTSNQFSDNNGVIRTESYGYDELSRLTSVNYGDGQTQSYAFDAMGNRSSKSDSVTGNESYAFNAANMLLSRGGQSYSNDANGNTLTGGGRTNTWDSQNRLAQCVYNGNTSSFQYGADGLRRKAIFNGSTTHYALDSSNVVREFAQDAQNPNMLTVTATYLTGPQGPMYRRPANAADVRWYLYDGLGSVLGEVDVNGNVTATKKHDVYGLTRQVTGTPTSKHGFVGSLGHASDDETGMVYMRARYYDPVTGRFASEDTAKDGVNWFAYCNNDPVGKVDPSGKVSVDSWAWAGLGMIWAFAAVGALSNTFPAPGLGVIPLLAGLAAAAASVYCFFKALDANLDDRAIFAVIGFSGGVGGWAGSALYAEMIQKTMESATMGGKIMARIALPAMGAATAYSFACIAALALIDMGD